MFQSNAAKEVLYIFLWLVGIVFVYGLVHSFLLEPSQTKTSTKHDIHSVSNTVKKASLIPTVTKVESVASSVVSSKTIKTKEIVHEMVKEPKTAISKDVVNAPTIEKVEVAEKVIPKVPAKQETIEKASLIPNPSSHIKIPDVPTVTKVESVTSSVVSSKTVENTVSSSAEDNTAINLPSMPSVPTVPSIPSIKKVEDMELLDTATKHVNELVKTPQDKVLETIK